MWGAEGPWPLGAFVGGTIGIRVCPWDRFGVTSRIRIVIQPPSPNHCHVKANNSKPEQARSTTTILTFYHCASLTQV